MGKVIEMPGPAEVLKQQIDEAGKISDLLAPFRAAIAREEQLRKAIRAACDTETHSAALEIREQGQRYFVILSPRAMESAINIKKLVREIGTKAYAAFAVATLKALKANCTPEVVAAVVTSGQTGNRTLKIYSRDIGPSVEHSPVAISDELLEAA
jgi:hypothetical protein